MGRRLATAAAILLVVFMAGYLVYNQLFATDEAQSPAVERAIASANDAAVEDIALVPETEQVKVRALKGSLERRDESGEWQPLAVGDLVSVSDALRTVGLDASATLEIGEQGTTVELAGEFTVPFLSSGLSTVEIVDGRLAANVVAASESRLRVAARGSSALAETDDGEFSVISTGKGQVAVASRRGKVAVNAAGGSVEVTEGQQSVVIGDGPPSRPETLPTALLLKVGKTAQQLRVRETIVRGTTTPGAIVSIGTVRVQANERGMFETKVTLREGRNRLKLVVEDAIGRTKAQTLPEVLVDSKAPDVQTGVEW